MTEEKFEIYVNIIRACRDYDCFTNSDAARYTETSETFIRTYTTILHKIGSLIKTGMVKQGRHYIPQYTVAPDAVTQLYRYVREIRGEPEPNPVIKCPSKGMKRIKFCGRVVNKAYISPGFGRSVITDIDSRLKSVRNKAKKPVLPGDTAGACEEMKCRTFAGGKQWQGLINRRKTENVVCRATLRGVDDENSVHKV